MVIDTSAIIAIILREADGPRLRALVEEAPAPVMSSATYTEAGIVMLGKRGEAGVEAFEDLVRSLRISVIPFEQLHADLAIAAYGRFGKGRHPAGLNYGDCFSYALAQARGEPLLAKGNDFVRTDAAMAG